MIFGENAMNPAEDKGEKKQPSKYYDGPTVVIEGEEDTTIRPYPGVMPPVPQGPMETSILTLNEDEGEPPYTWQSANPKP
jgi:hypothetical protein